MSDDFGLSDLNRLAADLTNLSGMVYAEVRKSMQQTAMETKKVHQKEASKISRVGHLYAPTIDYTIEGVGVGHGRSGGTISVEVGPNLERYGRKTRSVGAKSVKGGLSPSFGFLDDPDATGDMTATPSRARRVAEKFAEKELVRRLEIARDESARRVGL